MNWDQYSEDDSRSSDKKEPAPSKQQPSYQHGMQNSDDNQNKQYRKKKNFRGNRNNDRRHVKKQNRNATQEEIEDLFDYGLVNKVIPIGQDGVVYDLEFTNKINLFKVAQKRSFNLRNREIYIRNSIKNNPRPYGNRNHHNNRYHRGNNRGNNRDYRGRNYQQNRPNEHFKKSNYGNNNYGNNNYGTKRYQQHNNYNKQNLHLSRKGQNFGNEEEGQFTYKNNNNFNKEEDKKNQPVVDQKSLTGLAKVTDNEYVIVDNKSNMGQYKNKDLKTELNMQRKEINQFLIVLQMEQKSNKYDFDIFVIGGGSGGLAAAQKAADMGKKVGLADYVEPSPQGTVWGLGGTCVNVGCIPKKLMHQVSLFGEQMEDMNEVGWTVDTKAQHKWNQMLTQVNNHVRSLNWGYKSTLAKKGVEYYNMFATLEGDHQVKLVDKDGKEQVVTASNILIAVGGRPSYLNVEGAKEFCQTSDDIFWSKEEFGKCLVIGAGYIAMECGGFLNGLGKDVTILYRSQPLRNFDSQIADRLVQFMSNKNINFLKGNAIKFEKNNNKIQVTLDLEGEQDVQEYDNVLMAVGRTPLTSKLNLQSVNIETNKKGKLKVNEKWQTSVPYIYAIGDVIEQSPELTPVAIKEGRYLVDGIFNNKWKTFDYTTIPTTIFTPLEYSCCGMSEDKAIEKYGEDNIEVYHTEFKPLEWNLTFNHYEDNAYAKLIVKIDTDVIVGAHYLGPNAGEVMQGFSMAVIFGIKFQQLDSVVGIHPTCAEELVSLFKTKREFPDAQKESC